MDAASTFAGGCRAPRTFTDPNTGIVCTRRDNRPGLMVAYSFMTSARVGDDPVTLIFYHLYTGLHSKGRRLCDFRVASFKNNVSVLKEGITLSTVRSLYSSVETELRKFVTQDMRERELSKKDIDIDPCEDKDPDPLRTLKEKDWLPHMHTTMVAIYQSGQVFVAGPGACSVVLLGDKIEVLSESWEREKREYVNLRSARLGRDQLLVISESDKLAGLKSRTSVSQLQAGVEDQHFPPPDLGRTFVMAKFV